MKIARQAQNRLGMKLAQHPCQSRQYRAQTKPAVETVTAGWAAEAARLAHFVQAAVGEQFAKPPLAAAVEVK